MAGDRSIHGGVSYGVVVTPSKEIKELIADHINFWVTQQAEIQQLRQMRSIHALHITALFHTECFV